MNNVGGKPDWTDLINSAAQGDMSKKKHLFKIHQSFQPNSKEIVMKLVYVFQEACNVKAPEQVLNGPCSLIVFPTAGKIREDILMRQNMMN